MFRVIQVQKRITEANDIEADKLRQEFKEKKILSINLMSSPGSGKSTFLSKTIELLKNEYSVAVLEADIDSDVDAIKMEQAGANTVQMHTNGMCHVDADMTRQALENTNMEGVDFVFLENVGNLICPAEYDTGCEKKVMILSIPEGDDKPLKYPLMFQESDVVIFSKIDALPYFSFDVDICKKRIQDLNPNAKIFPLSAKTGEGMQEWIDWLIEEKGKLEC